MSQQKRSGVRCPACSTDFFVRDANHLFKGKSRCPMLLHCGHNICFSCLKAASQHQTEISCSACHSTTEISGSADRFPINYHLLGLLVSNRATDANPKYSFHIELVPAKPEPMPASVSQNSDRCVECRRKGVAFECMNCVNFFCRECFNKVHSSAMSLRSHKTRAVLSVGNVALDMCEEHGKVKDFYCTTDEDVICANCALVGSHKGHNVITVLDKNKSSVLDIETALGKAKIAGKCLQSSRKMLRKFLEHIESHSQDSILTIRDYYQNLHSRLQIIENDAIKQLTRLTESRCESLNALAHRIEMDYCRLQAIIIDGHDQLNSPSKLVNPDLLNELLCIEKFPCYLPLSDGDITLELQFLPKFNVSDNPLAAVIPDIDMNCEPHDPSKLELLPFSEVSESMLSAMLDLDDSSSMPDLENLQSVSMESLDSYMTETTVSHSVDDTQSQLSKHTFRNEQLSSRNPPPQLLRSFKLKPPNWSSSRRELVTVKHIESPHEFYIQRQNDVKVMKELNKTIANLDRKNKFEKALVHSVDEAGVYMAYHNKKRWCRVCVTACEDEEKQADTKVEVLYIDYGSKDVLSSSRLRHAPPEVLDIPALAVKCSLWKIEPYNQDVGWTRKAIKQFCEMVLNKQVEMRVMENAEAESILYVDLGSAMETDAFSRTPLSVRESLVFLEHGCFSIVDVTAEIAATNLLSNCNLKSYFERSMPTKGQDIAVYVSHLEDLVSFFVQSVEECIYLSELMHEMQSVYRFESRCLPPLMGPYIGMPCAALYSTDKQWYRAEVINLKAGSQLEVFYVDFGNKAIVSYTDVKRLHEKFMTYPKIAFRCTLADVKAVDADNKETFIAANKFFHDKVYLKTLRIHVEDVSDKQLLVSLYLLERNKETCINSLLVSEKYLVGTGPCALKPAVVSFEPDDDHSQCLSDDLEENPCETKDDIPRNEDGVAKFDIKVHISCVVSPEHIFIQPRSSLARLKSFMRELHQTYSSTEMSEGPWNISALYAVFNSKDKCWYRGRLQNRINEDTYEALLIDFGETIEVKDSNIRRLADHFATVQRFAIECCLEDVMAPGGSKKWPSITLESLQELATAHDAIYLKKMGDPVDGVVPVQLFYEDVTVADALAPTMTTYVSIAELLIENGMALPNHRKADALQASHMTKRASNASAQDNYQESNSSSRSYTRSRLDTTSLDSTKGSQLWFSKWKPPEYVLTVGQRFAVTVTHVTNNCELFFHDIVKSSCTLNMIKNALNAKYEGTKPQPHDLYWDVNQPCIAHYKTDDEWCRGIVKLVDLDKKKFKVHYIDYGSEEFVGADSLRKDVILMDLPQQGIYASLYNLIPATEDEKWSPRATKFLSDSLVSKSCEVVVKTLPSKNQYMAVSVIVGPVILESTLVEMGLAKYKAAVIENDDYAVVTDEYLSSENDEEDNTFYETFPELDLPPVGEVFGVEITEIQGPDAFYIQRKATDNPQTDYHRLINKHCSSLTGFSSSMNAHAESWPLLKRVYPGSPCCAQYEDESWFRASVIEESENEISVFYVDFGNQEVISRNRVRELPSKMIKLPVQAISCKLHQVVPVIDWASVEPHLRSIYESGDGSLFARVKDTQGPLHVDLLRSVDDAVPNSTLELAYQPLIESNLLKLVRQKTREELL